MIENWVNSVFTITGLVLIYFLYNMKKNNPALASFVSYN